MLRLEFRARTRSRVSSRNFSYLFVFYLVWSHFPMLLRCLFTLLCRLIKFSKKPFSAWCPLKGHTYLNKPAANVFMLHFLLFASIFIFYVIIIIVITTLLLRYTVH